MNHYKILTVTHKQVPVEQLANYVIRHDKGTAGYAEKLQSIKQTFQLSELMYLNTCNRVTYFFTTKTEIGSGFTTQFFKTVNSDFEACNTVNADLYEGQAAIAHLCEIGASIDSLVVGEREIIRQLRVAYEESQHLNLTGDDIRLAMKFVIPAAKKIFTETKIAEKPISVVSLAAQRLKDLKVPATARFLLVGAGETITQMTTYLLDMGYSDFSIFNRTLANAEKLVAKTGGKAFALSTLSDFKTGFDVIISSTGSPDHEITADIYRKLLGDDASRKVIIDLAVPADIDPAIPHIFHVDYTGIDQLRQTAQQNLGARKAEVVKAKRMVHEFVKEFQTLYLERMVEKAHSIIPLKLNEIRKKAVEEVYAKDVATLDENAVAVMNKLLDYMEKKYIALTMASSKDAFRHKHQ